jgi:hypothetical protein
MKHLILLSLTALIGVLGSCKEDSLTDRIDKAAPAPAPIENNSVTVKNIPGGAILYYTIPDDDNLLYVKAVYETTTGIVREAKASRYVDSINIEGYGAAGNYSVDLFSVGRNEKISDAVKISVSPLAPPVIDAMETLKLSEGFGSVRGSFENPTRTPITAVLMADMEGNGIYSQLRAYTLSDPISSFVYSGLDSIDINVKVYLKDHFGNKSGESDTILRPWFEQEIPKLKWNKYDLPSDFSTAAESESTYGMQKIWDGIYDVRSNTFATAHTAPAFPYTFTFSVGQYAKISRFVLHHRLNFEYSGKTPKKFELWASGVESPRDDLILSGDWFCLGVFHSKIPSGAKDGTGATVEDKAYANANGEQFYIEPSTETPDPYLPVKYIRFRTGEVWDGSTAGQIIISEIDLYGQIVN